VFDILHNGVRYQAEQPQLGEGLKVTLTAHTADGKRHRDRLNLDRASVCRHFAEAAGIAPEDLQVVRDLLMDALMPPPGEPPAPGSCAISRGRPAWSPRRPRAPTTASSPAASRRRGRPASSLPPPGASSPSWTPACSPSRSPTRPRRRA